MKHKEHNSKEMKSKRKEMGKKMPKGMMMSEKEIRAMMKKVKMGM